MNNSSLDVAGLNVSRETYEKLIELSALITKWTKAINLIAPASVPEIWDRHIIDSAQVYRQAGDTWSSWADLGSGGGLPGLVIAILDQESRAITLVESDIRKCLFLKTVKRELDLNVVVVNERIEAATLKPVNIVSARALAPLCELLAYTETLLTPDGFALFSKGARYQDELDGAAKQWNFECEAFKSLTNQDARILKISRICRREP